MSPPVTMWSEDWWNPSVNNPLKDLQARNVAERIGLSVTRPLLLTRIWLRTRPLSRRYSRLYGRSLDHRGKLTCGTVLWRTRPPKRYIDILSK